MIKVKEDIMPQATINNSVYVLTEACEKPRMKCKSGSLSAYLPLTVGTAENFWIKGTNGSSYRPLVTSTTSSSESASSSTTYYTSQEYSEGLTNTTALTSASYYMTTSGGKGYLSSITDLTKPEYYKTQSNAPGNMSSITGLTAANSYGVTGYYSVTGAIYTTTAQYNSNLKSITDLWVDRVSTGINPHETKWTRTGVIWSTVGNVTLSREMWSHVPGSTRTVDMMTEIRCFGQYTSSSLDEQYNQIHIWGDLKTDYNRYTTTFYINGDEDYNETQGDWGYPDYTSMYTTNKVGVNAETWFYSTIDPLSHYVGTSRSTTAWAGYQIVTNAQWTWYYTSDSRTRYIRSSSYLTEMYTSGYSGWLSSSKTTGYSGWLSRSKTTGYSGVSSSSISTSSSMSTTTWN